MTRPSRTGGKTSAAKARDAGPAKGRKTTKTKPRIAPAATRVKRRSISDPSKELKEAREQQAATAEILKVIAGSPNDIQPVFEAIVASANRLIGGYTTAVFRFIDGYGHLAAFTPINPDADEKLKAAFPQRSADVPIFRPAQAGEVLQIDDTEKSHERLRDIARARGFRSVLYVPLKSKEASIGVIATNRRTPGPFSAHDVQLLKTFADQAVIAIENVRLFNDTKEALEHQTATAEVLKVISSSMANPKPVFERIVDSIERLFKCKQIGIFLTPGDGWLHLAAGRGINMEAAAGVYPQPVEQTAAPIVLGAQQQVYYSDVLNGENVPPSLRRAAQVIGNFSDLLTPLSWKDRGVGLMTITREPNATFSDKERSLLRTFADQAVIAIENARLFDEVQAKTADLTESLQQQTATADVLKVISRSAFDLEAVLNTLVRSAVTLSGARTGTIFQKRGELYHLTAEYGYTPGMMAYGRANPIAPGFGSNVGRTAMTGAIVQIPDVLADPDFTAHGYQRVGNFRAMLGVPLKRDGKVEGVFSLAKPDPGPFEPRHVELVQTFADQAVIAIENVRLFDEVQAKTRDLSESLEQQTATSEVLGVISRSLGQVEPVFQSMLGNAMRICEAQCGAMFSYAKGAFRAVSCLGVEPRFETFLREERVWGPETGMGRAVGSKQPVHVVDTVADLAYAHHDPDRLVAVEIGGVRTFVIVPMLKDGELIGAMSLYRRDVRAYTDKQIKLVSTFAEQAVIAIENTRLFNEVQAKTADLSESLQQQTATADVLKVISRSTFDLQTVLQTLVESAAKLCDAEKATITRQKNGVLFRGEFYGFSDEFMDYVRNVPVIPDRGSATARALLEGVVVHIPDVKADPDYTFNEAQKLGDFRTIIGVPMLREGKAIGVIVMTRSEVRPFTDKQIELATTFADQAAIAIENVRLFDKVEARTRELAASLHDLHAAQDRLVQTEKLASLGQLTAGIAHEIKNPLNFINNFSTLSVELIDELHEALAGANLDAKLRGEISEIAGMLQSNLDKVVQHGRRADSIVKNMLLHSREGSGEHRPADINSLLDESLNLAYHGARAEKGEFNITLERDFDADAGTIELFPQEVTRAFLNLIANGVYAATRRKTEDKEPGFEPTLRASTKNLGTTVEIRIRDNGTGIPVEVQQKMFNPFFTTKPAGEGTGLGLSMTHDIIVKQHGGRIDVATEPGQFTEFVIVLPRQSSLSSRDRGET